MFQQLLSDYLQLQEEPAPKPIQEYVSKKVLRLQLFLSENVTEQCIYPEVLYWQYLLEESDLSSIEFKRLLREELQAYLPPYFENYPCLTEFYEARSMLEIENSYGVKEPHYIRSTRLLLQVVLNSIQVLPSVTEISEAEYHSTEVVGKTLLPVASMFGGSFLAAQYSKREAILKVPVSYCEPAGQEMSRDLWNRFLTTPDAESLGVKVAFRVLLQDVFSMFEQNVIVDVNFVAEAVRNYATTHHVPVTDISVLTAVLEENKYESAIVLVESLEVTSAE